MSCSDPSALSPALCWPLCGEEQWQGLAMAVPQGLQVLAQIWYHGGSYVQRPSVLLTPPPPSFLIPTIAILHICQHHGDVLRPSMSWGCS